LLRVKEHRISLHELSKRKANWIGHILRRNCLLQRVVEGKMKGGIEVTGRSGRGRRRLPEDLKERRGHSHLKEEALDHTMWGARFGTIVRQTTKWIFECIYLNAVIFNAEVIICFLKWDVKHCSKFVCHHKSTW